jgi:hypothetical protein
LTLFELGRQKCGIRANQWPCQLDFSEKMSGIKEIIVPFPATERL